MYVLTKDLMAKISGTEHNLFLYNLSPQAG